LASALSGIKVLDITGLGPASLVSMTMGDMGAEVLKIDMPPGGGHRGVGDGLAYFPESDEESERMTAHMATNRNKKSLALNLRTEAGQAIFHKLAWTYDVVIESFRPGVMDRMNVGYQNLAQINPRIIYCSVSGYGQDGPYRSFPGHDANYSGMGGVLGLTGERHDAPPVMALNVVADMAVAYRYLCSGEDRPRPIGRYLYDRRCCIPPRRRTWSGRILLYRRCPTAGGNDD